MPQRRPDRPYYFILGLPPEAKEEDVKGAYRRLALKYHPDKNPTADPAKFTQIGKAYEILGNPKKRNIYDRYGEFGLTMLEKTGSPGMTDFLLNTRKQAWIIFLVMLLLLLFLSQPFLIAFKLNGYMQRLSWRVIFVPLWTFHAFAYTLILLFSALALMTDGSEEDAEVIASKRVGGRWVYWWIVLYPLLIWFTLSIVLRVDKVLLPTTWTWPILFTPYFVFEGLYFILKVSRIVRISISWPGNDPVLPLIPASFTFLTYQELRWSLVRILFATVFLGSLTAFKPAALIEATFILGFVWLLIAPLADLLYWRAYKFAARESRNADRLPHRMLTVSSFSVYILSIITLMTFLGLFYARVGASASISWIWVFFPFLLVCGLIGGLMVLCMPCVFCCCIVRDDTMYDDFPTSPQDQAASITPVDNKV